MSAALKPEIFPTHWVTGIRTPVCRQGHPYVSLRQTGNRMVMETRGDCHHFMSCIPCGESAFGVQAAAHETIGWYHCTKAQLQDMLSMPATTKTWVFLEYLGYMNGGYDR